MIHSIRETGCPRMDRLDDAASQTEILLTRASCYVLPAPLAGATKIIMGIFQTILGVGGTLYSMARGDTILKERWVTQIKNGLANVVRGALEAIPFVGLGLAIRAELIKASYSCRDDRHLVSTDPSFNDDLFKIRYPSIQLRTWKITTSTGNHEDKTRGLTQKLEEEYKIKLEEANNPSALWERVKILDTVFAAYNNKEDTQIFVGQVTIIPDEFFLNQMPFVI